MELKQPEIIQILRKRAGLNQGTLGEQSFDTSFESGRTKIKNIELGKQIPTEEDLKRMAAVLGVPWKSLLPGSGMNESENGNERSGAMIEEPVLSLYPGLKDYIDMLNKAVQLDDSELTTYIAEKISHLLTSSKVSRKISAAIRS